MKLFLTGLLASIASGAWIVWTAISRVKLKAKLKGSQNKVTALETEDEIDNLNDDVVASDLNKWLRDDDK